MSLTPEEQERYHRLAALEEQPGGTSTEGHSHVGATAAEIGHQLLLEALGSEQAVERAVRGGRPSLSGKSGPGSESPTIRVRVTPGRKHDLEILKTQMNCKSTSDIVRAAIDEYVENHLRASA